MTAATAAADPVEITRALSVLFTPAQVVELRALNVSRPGYRAAHTVSGYFDDRAALTREAVALSDVAHGVYVTLQEIKPALLARRANRAEAAGAKDPLTSDGDVQRFRRLAIDCDPQRPTGISSSDEEHAAALVRAGEIRDWLRAEGWPDPIEADSGNGAHLLYAVDLPVSDKDILKRCLEALAFRFDDAAVAVDQTVFNPARIWKLYGTRAGKGDSIADRPHRIAQLLRVPETLEVVTPERLTALAETVPKTEPRARHGFADPAEGFDIARWIKAHHLDVQREGAWNGTGYRWILAACPWNSDHQDSAACIVQLPSGAVSAGCRHSSCAGKDWYALRDTVEPGWRERRNGHQDAQGTEAENSFSRFFNSGKREKRENEKFTLTRVGDLLTEPIEETPWLVAEMLPAGGVSILAAKPKVGKSTLVRNLALAVARGAAFLDRDTSAGPVVYLALEEKRSEVQKHFRRLGAGEDDIYVHVGSAPADALPALAAKIIEHGAVLAIADPLGRFIRVSDLNDYAVVTKAFEPLMALARETGCHIVLVHHLGKMDRADGDGLLGSTALFGAVDSVLTMRKRDDCRVISTIQRYGTDLPETVVALDEVTGAVAPAGTLAEKVRSETADRILDFLGDDELTEADIRERVGGNTGLTAKVLRWLFEHDYLARTGAGRRGDPYKYSRFSRFPTPNKREKRENENVSEHCQRCDAELPPGQGGLCDACDADLFAEVR